MFAQPEWQFEHLFALFICGILVVLVNAAIVTVVLLSSHLRNQFLLITVIGIADVLFGLSTALAAFIRWRKMTFEEDYPDGHLELTFPSDCLYQWWLAVDLVGGQWPAWTKTIIGVKRILGVFCPHFYHHHCTLQRRLLLVSFSLIIVLIFLFVAYASVKDERAISPLCMPIEIFTPTIDLANRFLIVLAHFVGFILSAIAQIVARWKFRHLTSGTNDLMLEAKKVTVILTVTGIDILTVCLPIIFLTVIDYQLWKPEKPNCRFIALLIFTISSIVNGPIYLILNMEFRSRVLQLLFCGYFRVPDCQPGKQRCPSLRSIRSQGSFRGKPRVSLESRHSAPLLMDYPKPTTLATNSLTAPTNF